MAVRAGGQGKVGVQSHFPWKLLLSPRNTTFPIADARGLSITSTVAKSPAQNWYHGKKAR